jgi:hypothetical protein
MVIVKASKNSEAGVTPNEKLLTKMGRFNEELPPSSEPTRAYFRSLRAAELAAWEMTGGDYLQSCFVTQF